MMIATSYFQGQLDTVVALFGEKAAMESRKAANHVMEEATRKARELLADTEEEALEAIGAAKERAVAVIADANSIAPNERASLKVQEYLSRKWCIRTSMRMQRSEHQNTTELPIDLVWTTQPDTWGLGSQRGACRAALEIDGVVIADDRRAGSRRGGYDRFDNIFCTITATIPPRAKYVLVGAGRGVAWHELRAGACP